MRFVVACAFPCVLPSSVLVEYTNNTVRELYRHCGFSQNNHIYTHMCELVVTQTVRDCQTLHQQQQKYTFNEFMKCISVACIYEIDSTSKLIIGVQMCPQSVRVSIQVVRVNRPRPDAGEWPCVRVSHLSRCAFGTHIRKIQTIHLAILPVRLYMVRTENLLAAVSRTPICLSAYVHVTYTYCVYT